MSASLKKTVVGSLAALVFGISTVVSVAPALAQAPLHPHPGGGHPPVGAHGGHGFGGGGGHWHGGGWGPAAVGLGVLGLAAGAAIASQGPGYYGDDGCVAYRPIYDAYGNYMGRRPVNVC